MRRTLPGARMDALLGPAAPARQSLRCERPVPRRLGPRRADLGRHAARDLAAVVGVLEPGGPIVAAPIATYRVQLTGSFGFADAARIVPYLRDLGISHLYASPILKARAGSTHGYDVVDPTQLNPELGGDAGFARLAAALGDAGMGLIVDFVPNHMGVHHADNPWWLD